MWYQKTEVDRRVRKREKGMRDPFLSVLSVFFSSYAMKREDMGAIGSSCGHLK